LLFLGRFLHDLDANLLVDDSHTSSFWCGPDRFSSRDCEVSAGAMSLERMFSFPLSFGEVSDI